MVGNRKLLVTMVFMLCSVALIWRGIELGRDVAEVGVALVALAPAIAAFMWGNRAEHQAKAEMAKAAMNGNA